jgi:hypothetical protein
MAPSHTQHEPLLSEYECWSICIIAIWHLVVSQRRRPKGIGHARHHTRGRQPVWALLGSAPQELNTMRPEAKLLIREARARNPNRFFSALAVETLLPASDSRCNYSDDFFVDTPRSSRSIHSISTACNNFCIGGASPTSMCGGHQKVINVVGDGTKLLLNNRPAESGALRFEIVSLDLCRVL